MSKYIEIVLVLVLAIYSIVTVSKWNKLNWLRKIIVILTILCASFIAWNGIGEYKKQILLEKINDSFGELIDKKKATIPELDIGNSNTGFILDRNGVFGSSQNGNLLKIYIKENKLYLNIIIRDNKGKVIAVVSENIWTIYDNDYEYNNDEKSFEIVTKGDRKLFFHIELINAKVCIEGFMFNEIGKGFLFDSTNDPDWVEVTYMSKDIYAIYQKNCNIKNIFKYPRGKYYGVRLD